MNLTNFTEIMARGLNNPDCSLYVGLVGGQIITMRIILYFAILFIIFKAIDKLAIEPLILFIKGRIFTKKNKGEKNK